jgi:hypothetical protein
MIINSHAHMHRFEVDFSREIGEFYVDMFAGHPCWYTGEPWRPEDFCVSVDRLIDDMDRLHIDKTFVLGGTAYLPMNSYDPDSPSYVHEMISAYPDRLVGFHTVNPLGGLAEVRRFEHAVNDLGLRGMKMLPSYNYIKLNDRRIWPLFEIAQELGTPVVIHTGWSSLPKGKMLEYDHPLFLEDVALDFPDLKIVMAHLGFQWAPEAMHFMAKFPNVYADFAFWAETAPLFVMAQTWVWGKKLGVSDRFMWGSDYPYVDFNTGLEFFREVPGYCERHELEPVITDEDIESFFGGAALRLMDESATTASATRHC